MRRYVIYESFIIGESDIGQKPKISAKSPKELIIYYLL